jgi:phytoene synthase
MQLTNVARDVGEDARNGRVYLPLAWLRDAGLDADTLIAEPRFSWSLGDVVRRLLAVADVYYASADEGIAMLPRDCRVAIEAARRIYADIGREIGDASFDSVTRRAMTARGRKAWLLVRALPVAVAAVGEPTDRARTSASGEHVRALVRATIEAVPVKTMPTGAEQRV